MSDEEKNIFMSLIHEEKRKFGAKQKIEKLIFVAKKKLRRKFEKKIISLCFSFLFCCREKIKIPKVSMTFHFISAVLTLRTNVT